MKKAGDLSNPGSKANVTKNRQGFAPEVEPTWAPPESQPEPRPQEPILDRNPSPTSNPSTNTNSPA